MNENIAVENTLNDVTLKASRGIERAYNARIMTVEQAIPGRPSILKARHDDVADHAHSLKLPLTKIMWTNSFDTRIIPNDAGRTTNSANLTACLKVSTNSESSFARASWGKTA